MKKIIIYILLFTITCFALPIIFTQNKEQKLVETANNNEIENAKEENIEQPNYEYKKYNTIKLLHAKTGEIQEIQIDEYLKRSSICRNASKF